jgi:hypothetical protein
MKTHTFFSKTLKLRSSFQCDNPCFHSRLQCLCLTFGCFQPTRASYGFCKGTKKRLGIEPKSRKRLTCQRPSQKYCDRRGLNPRPLAHKTNALPLSYNHKKFGVGGTRTHMRKPPSISNARHDTIPRSPLLDTKSKIKIQRIQMDTLCVFYKIVRT